MVVQRKFAMASCLLALSALPGCVASTVASVVTAPVKLAGSAVDAVTTSQSEADEKRGRELRRREERLGQLEREYNKQSQRCAEGNAEACTRRDAAYAEMEQLRPTVPYQPQ